VADGFQQVVWTDDNTHKYIEEAGAMNIFVRIGDTLLTSPTSDRILDGITRKSILQLAEAEGIPTEVRKIRVQELLEASEAGSLMELFGAGTAAVVSPISSFGYKGERYQLPELEESYASFFKKRITDIQYNKADDPFGWRYPLV
jgi:branched-chain amino acid aminotransferase